ncbi:hypothetical protein [Burkholderia plantarii]|uniref:hypothetical protein n=1 Tax=Burkholderia plantarii TaxID=41899 RepID=UPI0008708519|nr:hypothetical protein [Burkholderia plantarii]
MKGRVDYDVMRTLPDAQELFFKTECIQHVDGWKREQEKKRPKRPQQTKAGPREKRRRQKGNYEQRVMEKLRGIRE